MLCPPHVVSQAVRTPPFARVPHAASPLLPSSLRLASQADLVPPKYTWTAAKVKDEGTIYLVKGLPFPWNRKKVGTFKLRAPDPLPRPVADMRVSKEN